MLFKHPWLVSRRRLLLSALYDITLVYIYSYVSFIEEFNESPNIVVYISLAAFWFFSSYVTGRYNLINNISIVNILKFLLLTFLILFISNFIYILINFGLTINISDRKLIFFFSKMTTEFSFFSIFGLYIINLFSRGNKKRTNKWLVISEREIFIKMKDEYNLSRYNINLEYTDYNFSNKNREFNSFDGVVIQDINKIKNDVINKLLVAKVKGVNVINLATFFDRYLQRIPLSLVNYSDILDNKFDIDLNSYEQRIKRCGDIIFSIITFIITMPIILISGLLIFIDDGLPIFYSQERNGLKGKPFKLIKLRTMYKNSERDGIQWTKRGDERITKIGKYLRYMRIDELPQLLMVIKGDMSLIGPRPERPQFDILLEKNIPYYNLRFCTRPGISGWAQVNYSYGSSIKDSENKLSYDIYYLCHFSLFLDFLILFKTIKLILNASGSQPIEN